MLPGVPWSMGAKKKRVGPPGLAHGTDFRGNARDHAFGLSNGKTLCTLARTQKQMSGRFETNIARKAYHDVTSMISAADLIVYLGPGDADVWAEIGHAKALGKTIFGVWTANEQITISRWAVTAWVSSNCELIRHVNLFHEKLIKYKTREEAAS